MLKFCFLFLKKEGTKRRMHVIVAVRSEPIKACLSHVQILATGNMWEVSLQFCSDINIFFVIFYSSCSLKFLSLVKCSA